MQKRQSHKKSRNGCSNCKNRHVKCDEQGPPCANCVVRKTESTCNVVVAKRKQLSPSSQHLSPPSSGSEYYSHANSTSAAPLPSSHPPRLIELELMNRWTSHTWRSFSAVASDEHYLQVIIPRDALTHPYLMNGILCAAALDIAVCSRVLQNNSNPPSPMSAHEASSPPDVSKYIRAALEYYSAGSALYRAELATNITPENLHRLYIFSCILTMLNLVIPQFTSKWDGDEDSETMSGDGSSSRHRSSSPGTNMLARVGTSFDLLARTSELVRWHTDWMSNSPFGPAMHEMYSIMQEPFLDGLPVDVGEALARLERVVEAGDAALLGPSASSHLQSPLDLETYYQTTAIPPRSSPNPGTAIPTSPPTDPDFELQSTYHHSLAQLRICFIEDARARIWGICTAFPALVNPGFVMAFKQGRPVALMILMYWAVLLERCVGERGWWAAGSGKGLVREIERVLVDGNPRIIGMRDWVAGIQGARAMVGLGSEDEVDATGEMEL